MPSANAILPSSVRLVTTDGAATVAVTIPTQSNHAYMVEAHIVATDGSTTAGYIRAAAFENNAGTLTQVGSTTSIGTYEDIANPMTVSFDTSGTEIRLLVTGDPGRQIVWECAIDTWQSAAVGS
jgi:hypothetical protein